MGNERKQTGGMARWPWGVFLLVLGGFAALSLLSYDWHDVDALASPPNPTAVNLLGPAGAWMGFVLFMAFGIGACIVPLWCLALGLMLIAGKQERFWPSGVLTVVAALSGILILELYPGWFEAARLRLNLGNETGGLLGWLLMRGFLLRLFSSLGAGIIVWALFVVSLVILIELRNILRACAWAWERILALAQNAREWHRERQDRSQQIESERRQIEKKQRRLERVLREKGVDPDGKEVDEQPEPEEPGKELRKVEPEPVIQRPEPAEEAPPPSVIQPEPVPAKPSRKQQKVAEPEAKPNISSPVFANYQLPSVSLLNEAKQGKEREIVADSDTTAKILVETLAEFGIEADVTNIEKGPVVTRYELLPAPGVRVEKISSLSNNIALALKATSVRVQAPVPGKGVVGIEVPNSTAKMVYLSQVINGEAWRSGKARLPLALGQDVAGNDLVADLAAMPHLLIAGATGTGKTVCMNSVLAAMLMSRTPEQLRMILVDPKIVEFAAYKDLPHLVVPVITNPKKVALGLRWAITEMERRYKLFAKVGVRNIEGFNNREVVKQGDLFNGEDASSEDYVPPTVPYIVIVIDELADLMLADQAEIENCIARLAQLSRAVGIHMILSTQRPSVNVITGTIKANFPARIAFQVAQKTDSRTILDTIGAEKLLGRGDMLFLPPGTSKLVRAQGAMTTDEEILRIVEHVKTQAKPQYESEIKDKLEKTAAAGAVDTGDEDEDLLNQAIAIVRETQRASTSSLQRRLRIGYTRAARVMDILEERGVVGPPRGSDAREILIDLDNEIPQNPAQKVTMQTPQPANEEAKPDGAR